MSNRKNDSRGEKAMALFLDKYFYPRLIDNDIIYKSERIYDRDQQIKGVDVILNDTLKIDEKAQLHFINNIFDGFSFEVNYYSENVEKIVDGWFVNESNQTDQYLLLWIPEAKTVELNRIVSEDFIHVKADLVSKCKIKQLLSEKGMDDTVLRTETEILRKNKIAKKILNENIYLRYSHNKYVEDPINLIIKKGILDSLSDWRIDIYKNRIEIC